MNGILPLWKPKGLTSHDCVKKIRHVFQMRKVGHTGTLDPEVEGVLVLCLGQATKIVPYLTEGKKTYTAQCALGISTETEDATGNIIETKKVKQPISKRTFNQVLQTFQGEITQTPPMYSAVRVKGKRLYEYARNHEQVERPSRQVVIHNIQLIDTNEENNTFEIKVVCSEGTYIRTLCVDIGKEIGYPAHMSQLIRSECSGFFAHETRSFSEILEAKEEQRLQDLLYPISRGLQHLDRIYVNKEIKRKVKHGQKLQRPDRQLETDPFLMMYHESVLGIYKIHPNNLKEIKPVRILIEQ